MLRYAFHTLALIGATLTLVACGSASDSSSDGGDSDTQVTGQISTDSVESAAQVGTVAASGTSAGSTGQESVSYAYAADNEADTQTRSLPGAALPCDEGGQMQVTRSNESFSLEFVQCMNDDGSYVNGSMQVQRTDNEDGTTNMSATYGEFEVTEADGNSVYIDGAILYSIQDYITGTMSLTSSRFESRVTEDGETNSVVLTDYNYQVVSSSSRGVVVNYDFYVTNENGTFHVWTEGNMSYATGDEGLNGILYIEGANAILTATLTSDSQSATAYLSLDVDKDGTEDLSGEMTQTAFLGESLSRLD